MPATCISPQKSWGTLACQEFSPSMAQFLRRLKWQGCSQTKNNVSCGFHKYSTAKEQQLQEKL